jgi:steroid 5-alpha reductase family enzyme
MTAFLTAATVLAVYMSAIFLLSLVKKDNSIVDIAYGGAFIAAVIAAAFISGPGHPRKILMLLMVGLWGTRLAAHLFARSRGRGEDFRYRKWRKEWGSTFIIRSFFQIYMLQGIVVFVVASPAVYVMTKPGGPPGVLDFAGVLIWLAGFFFETVGDYQLLMFKRDPANSGKIITTGLWRYTRHPNYFGECTLWWGIWIAALNSPGAYWTVISPLTINFLLLKVSGIPMLEKKYYGDPAFEEYKKRTNALIPWFPRP